VQFDPDSLASVHRYRLLISMIVPRPIAFVSTRSAAGRPNLAPFSFFMGVAGEPPLLALSISTRAGGLKDTARNLAETGEFVVNAATEDLAEAVNRASGDYAPEIDEFALTGLTPAPCIRVAPPRVAEAAFSLECRTHTILPFGGPERGTQLIVGEVVWMHVREDVLEATPEGGAEAAPLVDAARLRPIARLGKNLYSELGRTFALDRPRVRP
jgi:flavin reductase (DIM6/NTAB) family NADH-FMN oxidoreductase RutF